jgi:hypothetical protein
MDKFCGHNVEGITRTATLPQPSGIHFPAPPPATPPATTPPAPEQTQPPQTGEVPADPQVLAQNFDLVPVPDPIDLRRPPGERRDPLRQPQQYRQVPRQPLGPPAPTTVDRFQDTLRRNAQAQLQQNRLRLDQSQTLYQNLDPKNQNWARLRQDSAAIPSLNQRLYDNQREIKAAVSHFLLGTSAGAGFGLMGLETSAKARRASLVRYYQQQFGPRWAQEAPKLMPLIENYYALDAIREKAYTQNPALAVIQTGAANLPNTPENNRKLQQQITQGFNVTRDSIGKLEEGLKNDTDSSLALKFDQTLERTLAGITDPKQKAQVAAWVQQRQQAEREKQLAGGVGTVALLLGGIIAGATGAGLLAFILGAGTTVLGGAMAVDGLNTAAQRLDAVQAGDWGGNRLTDQSKISAQQEYAGAWLNVGLASLDAGLTAKTALGMLRAPQAVQTLSRLKPAQLDQFAEARALIQNGKARQAESLMQKMRGQMPPDELVMVVSIHIANFVFLSLGIEESSYGE